jgi:hypothetical protein
MAKFELKFFDCIETETSTYLKVEMITPEKEVFKDNVIQICGIGDNGETFNIWFDKSTSIKFAKTLRTEINKITESEVNNV